MKNGWIAITGSIDPSRQKELGLRNLDTATEAAEALGAALATAEFGLLVYSRAADLAGAADAGTKFPELAVIRGYVKSGKAQPNSIRSLYARGWPPPSFPEQGQAPASFVRPQVDSNSTWEFGFYRSIFIVDGLLVIGGGNSSLIVGVIARWRRIPIAAIEPFGGAASKIWQDLNSTDLANDEDRNVMASHETSAGWAEEIAASLLRQKREAAVRAKRDDGAKRLLNAQAVASVAFMLLAFMLIAVTWDRPGLERTWTLAALLAGPVFGGVAGSLAWSLYETVSQGTPQIRPVFITSLLGAFAGGVAGGFFVLAQLTALPPTSDGQLPSQVTRLVAFAAFTGLVAGLTLDRVCAHLRESSAVEPVTTASLSQMVKSCGKN